MNKKARVIAFYLPQFHPIPENDKWWGKGFTEWTNVGKAKPLFRGHKQPKIPADLGYYDLRVPEVREQQAQMAKDAGIEGFCYWHYWFGNGKRLLERPFQEVVDSGKPDFPFCLGWANHSWTRKTWINDKMDELLIEQTYGGEKDYSDHFYAMLQAFKDKRYLRHENKLIFLIWSPHTFPDFSRFKKIWNDLAKQNDLEGFYFIGYNTRVRSREDQVYNYGFDAVCYDGMQDAVHGSVISTQISKRIIFPLFRKALHLISYDSYTKFFLSSFRATGPSTIPCVLPNFDHSPRSGKRAIILHKSTPDKFKKFLIEIIRIQQKKQTPLLFIKSWNEWGEGNYLEPDLEYKNAYLEALKIALANESK